MEYPWFELQEDSADITQGDIIKGCPVPILKETDISEDGQNIEELLDRKTAHIWRQVSNVWSQ